MNSAEAVIVSAAVGAAAALAAAQRVFVGGVIVFVDPETFMKVLSKLKNIVVIHGVKGVINKTHVYIAVYQGVVFLTESKDLLPITPDIEAKSLQLPIGI